MGCKKKEKEKKNLNRQEESLEDKLMEIETRGALYCEGRDRRDIRFENVLLILKNLVLGVLLSSKNQININSPLSFI